MTDGWVRRRVMRCALAVTLGALSAGAGPVSEGASVVGGRRPPLLVGLDVETGKVRLEARAHGPPRYFNVIDVGRDLVFGEEAPCGRARITDAPVGDVFFVARDAETGKQRWEVPVKGMTLGRGPIPVGVGRGFSAAGSAPLVARGRDGSVRGLDRRTGNARWRRDVGPFDALGDTKERVFLGTGPDLDNVGATSLIALDRQTGEIAWQYDASALMRLRADASEDAVAVLELASPLGRGSATATLRSFDATTGQQRWEQVVPAAAVVFATGSAVVLTGTTSPRSIGFDALTGGRLWESDLVGIAAPPPAGDDLDAILALSAIPPSPDTKLAVFNPADGSLRWAFPVGGGTGTLAAGDRLVAQSIASDLVGIDADTGVERWRRALIRFGYSGVVGRDAVYIGGGCEVLEP